MNPYQQPLKQTWQDESGSVLIYVVLVLPVLLALAALAIDGSNMFAQERRMQNAADAAVLAGVADLARAKGTTIINADIQNFGTLNGADQTTWSSIKTNTGIQVNTAHTFSTFFAGMMGYHTLTVHAQSQAQRFPVTTMSNLIPMTARCGDFQFDQVYTMWGTDINASGSFGWLDWNGGSVSSNELAAAIANPNSSPTLTIGDLVHAGTGVQSNSNVQNALNGWINKSVTIPLFSTSTGTGSNVLYKICGFGQFLLLSYNFSGGNKWVQGKFIRTVVSSSNSTSSSSTVDSGIYYLRVIQ